MNGYAIPTSRWIAFESGVRAMGDIRNTHEIVPIPIATISESIKPSRSRPGLRRCTISRTPAIRHG